MKKILLLRIILIIVFIYSYSGPYDVIKQYIIGFNTKVNKNNRKD